MEISMWWILRNIERSNREKIAFENHKSFENLSRRVSNHGIGRLRWRSGWLIGLDSVKNDRKVNDEQINRAGKIKNDQIVLRKRDIIDK